MKKRWLFLLIPLSILAVPIIMAITTLCTILIVKAIGVSLPSALLACLFL